jgi:hypothetical protein
VDEVETQQVPAMVVNIVFARDFAIGGNIDAAVDLVGDRLRHAAGDDILGVGSQVGHRLFPQRCRVGGIGPVGMVEPVRQPDKIGLRIGTDTGCFYRHRCHPPGSLAPLVVDSANQYR